jgi:hypothetical protein
MIESRAAKSQKSDRLDMFNVYELLLMNFNAGGSESDDDELSDCALMAMYYLEQADQRKIGNKS